MKKNLTNKIFIALTIAFLFVLSEFFIPPVRNLFRGSILFLLPIFIFFLLGIALTISAIKEKIKNPLKKYLILTGASATGFFVCILLHNFIYGLFIFLFGENIWERIGTGDEPIFFIISIFICPIAFLIGIIGSLVIYFKKGKTSKRNK